ncbi:LysR family transcriptional regulator [Haloimpatiens massiliensis]|uniref:LysR family transcriptional regulator n=1 Tax=Haloimpatiens massiliensis TaxID=1658110 RepID=UPI0015E0EEAC|nr:LysR family transcriptional regulator [Haloimpatiens massiliensis]
MFKYDNIVSKVCLVIIMKGIIVMIDIKLKTFITVSQTKNFTKAANILNMTQPAISQHIKFLEQYYKVKLFRKSKNKIELTSQGEFLYQNALELDRLSKFIENSLENSTSFIKKYRLGASLTIGGFTIPNLISTYMNKNPNIDIILTIDNTENIVNKLLDGNIDLGAVEGPFDKTKVKYTTFKKDELILVASPKHPFAGRGEVNVEEVLRDKLILREKGSGTREVFEKYLIKSGHMLTDEHIHMEISNISATVSLVCENLGCTVISKEAVKEQLKKGTLIRVPIKGFNMKREFNFIYKGNKEPEFSKDFMSFCKEATSND